MDNTEDKKATKSSNKIRATVSTKKKKHQKKTKKKKKKKKH